LPVLAAASGPSFHYINIAASWRIRNNKENALAIGCVYFARMDDASTIHRRIEFRKESVTLR
jgi:hypothetical protein